jgi:outer membrane protein OmpA-like peptidoglycan-associated protein
MAFGDLGVRRGAAVTGAVAALAMISGCQSDRTSPPPATTARGPLIVAPTACADFTVSIYFASGSASIDRAGEALLAAAGARAARCSVTGVKVRGLADAPGGHDVNMVLSKRRAETVTRALRRHGFTQVEFQVSAIGDAPVESPGGDIHLLRRRVDLEIHLAAP